MKKMVFLALILAFGMTAVGNVNAQEDLDLRTDGYFTVTPFYFVEEVNGTLGGTTLAVIVNYSGPGGNVQIPAQLAGMPVVYIRAGAFSRKGLTSVSIPNSVTFIGDLAFDGNQLTSIIIPNGVTHIGEAAFAGNRLTNVNIPNGVTHIGALAFAQNQLTNVTIPNSVTHIGVQAFAGNRLTSVSVPSGTQVGENAFGFNGPNGNSAATITRR